MIINAENIAPYVPHSLKVIMEGKKCNVAWVSNKKIAVIRPNSMGEWKAIRWKYAHLNIKPVLRPVSDITKTFEHKGVLVSPMGELFGRQWFDWDGESSCPSAMRNTYLCSRGSVLPRFLENWVFTHLASYHIDLFGLIDKGLAVDINHFNANTQSH